MGLGLESAVAFNACLLACWIDSNQLMGERRSRQKLEDKIEMLTDRLRELWPVSGAQIDSISGRKLGC